MHFYFLYIVFELDVCLLELHIKYVNVRHIVMYNVNLMYPVYLKFHFAYLSSNHLKLHNSLILWFELEDKMGQL